MKLITANYYSIVMTLFTVNYYSMVMTIINEYLTYIITYE